MKRSFTTTEENGKYGIFTKAFGKEPEWEVGLAVSPIDNFLACFRENSCWMTAKTGNDISSVPPETQFLLVKNAKSRDYTVFFALANGSVRASFCGTAHSLAIKTETGDKNAEIDGDYIAYRITDADPFRAIKKGYEEIAERLGTFKLLNDKKTPKFIDYFGYNTYNAFYDNVTEEGVLDAVSRFKKNGLTPGFIILDVGWENYDGDRIASFYADEKKFPNGLKSAIEKLKSEYGVKKVMCWHVCYGFWKGVVADNFKGYGVEDAYFNVPDRHKHESRAEGELNTAGEGFYPDSLMNIPISLPCDLEKFYNDFYAAIKEQGADGTKVDAMTWIEAFGEDRGGRVKMMQRLVSSLEKASLSYFGGEHLNCSSCSNDFFYSLKDGVVVRTSNDYFPDDVESFGKHVYSNVMVSLFTSPILIADWDMFQSDHAGELQAVARAISGGPVYCTDKPEDVDYSIIKRLTTADGRVARCSAVATPTEGSLFHDLKGGELLRVFNSNAYGELLAAFNCRYDVRLKQTVCLAEVKTLKPNARYAVYSTVKGFVGVKTNGDCYEFDLGGYEAEVVHFVPIENGLAVFGLAEKYNCVGFIESIVREDGKTCVALMEAGRCLVYDERENAKIIEFNDKYFIL